VRGVATSGFQRTLDANHRFAQNAKALIGTDRENSGALPVARRAASQHD